MKYILLIGLVTAVKNQMSCGSCAAFAATGAHETCMLAGGARFNGLDLSEQYLIDCGYNPSGYVTFSRYFLIFFL
jgi:C1A family cysteine protease